MIEQENTHLGKLSPVQVMSGIIFEDENIINLGLVPNTTGQAEKKKKQVNQKVSGIELHTVSKV